MLIPLKNIRLTEILKLGDDQFKESPLDLNTEGVVAVTVSGIQRTSTPLVGKVEGKGITASTNEKIVSVVSLVTGHNVFVTETPDEIKAKTEYVVEEYLRELRLLIQLAKTGLAR